MRAKDTSIFVRELLGGSGQSSQGARREKLTVKICGTRNAEAAEAAIQAGADLIGIILVTGRKRCVSTETALEISKVVHNTPRSSQLNQPPSASQKADSYFSYSSRHLTHPSRAQLVGVFLDQPLEYVLGQQRLLNLDIVQLHGSEPIEWARLIPVPVIKSFKPAGPSSLGIGTTGYHASPLLDSGIGGTGEQLDVSDLKACLERDASLRVILAGGLDPQNVGATLSSLGDLNNRVLGVDVSSGVEENGLQSIEKIQDFVRAAKAVS